MSNSITEKVSASHILVKNRNAFDLIKELLDSGKSFEELAMAFSNCPSSDKGGFLGEFGRGRMVKPFEDAVFDMEVGSISKEPVVTNFGLHMIRRDK